MTGRCFLSGGSADQTDFVDAAASSRLDSEEGPRLAQLGMHALLSRALDPIRPQRHICDLRLSESDLSAPRQADGIATGGPRAGLQGHARDRSNNPHHPAPHEHPICRDDELYREGPRKVLRQPQIAASSGGASFGAAARLLRSASGAWRETARRSPAGAESHAVRVGRPPEAAL